MALGCSDVGLEASQGYQPSSLEASGGGPADHLGEGPLLAVQPIARHRPCRASQSGRPAQPLCTSATAGTAPSSRRAWSDASGAAWLVPGRASVIGRHRGAGWTGPGWLLVPADDHRIKARQQGGDSPVEFLQVVDPRWTGLGYRPDRIHDSLPASSLCLPWSGARATRGRRHDAGFRATWQLRSVMSSRVGRCSTAPPHPPWTWGWGSDSRNSIRRHR